jgi:hypothetical protein
MSNKSLIAVCLWGVVWAGTAQAGFLGNNLELQFLNTLVSTVSVTPTSDGTVVNGPVGSNITVTLNDTSVDVNNPAPILGEGLKITDVTVPLDPITYVQIDSIPSGTTHVAVFNPTETAALTATATVPEPGAFDLVALGLTILGMTIYQRKRVRA